MGANKRYTTPLLHSLIRTMRFYYQRRTGRLTQSPSNWPVASQLMYLLVLKPRTRSALSNEKQQGPTTPKRLYLCHRLTPPVRFTPPKRLKLSVNGHYNMASG